MTTRGLLRVLGLCALSGLALSKSPASVLSGRKSSEQFLLPILIFGPNNQAVGLKEGVALAKLLGRTAVLPPVYEHYSQLQTVTNVDHERVKQEQAMAFDHIYDPTSLTKFTKALTLEELQAAGWNGRVQALLYWSTSDFKYLERVKVSNVSAYQATNIYMSGRTACIPTETARLRERLKKYKFVGILIYNKLVENARHTSLAKPSINDESKKCYSAFRSVSASLTKSPAIQSIAERFIDTELGGGRFVAVHIRPYPDTCLTVWERREKPTASLCNNPWLHKQVGPGVAEAVKLAGLEGKPIFVASHPKIRPWISEIFAAHSLTPVYFDHHHMQAAFFAGGGTGTGDDAAPTATAPAAVAAPPATNGTPPLGANDNNTPGLNSSGDAGRRRHLGAGAARAPHVSLSLVMYVEQEIAFRSTVFLGTDDSSITGIIRQQRSASGIYIDRSRVFR